MKRVQAPDLGSLHQRDVEAASLRSLTERETPGWCLGLTPSPALSASCYRALLLPRGTGSLFENRVVLIELGNHLALPLPPSPPPIPALQFRFRIGFVSMHM